MAVASLLKRPSFWTALALIIGPFFGWYLGEGIKVFLPISMGIIEVFKTIAIPLLFFGILDSLVEANIHIRGVRSLALICILNASLAVIISLFYSSFFFTPHRLDAFADLLRTPQEGALKPLQISEILTSLAMSPMIGAILSAIFLGTLFRFLEKKWSRRISTAVSRILKKIYGFLLSIVHVIIWVVPLAVFISIANAVAQHGIEVFQILAWFVGMCILGLLTQGILVYHFWIIKMGGFTLKRFWRAASEPVIYAFGVNSSLATIPLTLKALDRLKVSDQASKLSVCIGTNFNNDGILLYEVMAAFFLLGASGIYLDIAHQILLAVLCMIAAFGVGGIPEAGIISLALVMSALKLPYEGVLLLLSVDWLLARMRSAVNVVGDMSVAIGIDAMQKPSAASP